MSRIRSTSTVGRNSGRVDRLAGVRREQLRGPDVPLGRGLEREPERLRRGQGDRHAVRHHRLVGRVVLGWKSFTCPAIG